MFNKPGGHSNEIFIFIYLCCYKIQSFQLLFRFIDKLFGFIEISLGFIETLFNFTSYFVFIKIYHVWEGYLRKILVERRQISRAEWRGKFSLKTVIFRKYTSQA